MKKICKKLKYHNYFIVEATGNASGIALIWEKELQINNVRSFNNVVHYLVGDLVTKRNWNLLTVYSTPYSVEKGEFWR